MVLECILRGGGFDKWLMVCRQLGVGNFEPLKQYFLEVYGGAQASLPALPGIAARPVALDRGWNTSDDRKLPTSPALVRQLPCS